MEIQASRCTNGTAVSIGRALVRTGIAVQLPPGSVGRIASRSGMSTRLNVEVGAGWIDSDYRGEVMIELKNFSAKPVTIAIGDRVAHLLVLRTVRVQPEFAGTLPKTKRGTQGFGSTGGAPKDSV